MVPISGALGLLFTPRIAYRKSNHSHLKPLEYLSRVLVGGCCPYAKSRPVEALEIRLTRSGVAVFLVQYLAILCQ